MRLTKEQIQIASYDSPGYYAVKGVAGSGKTSIGIQRISYLLENKCPGEEDKILVLTFNRSLIKYLEYLYEKFSSSFPRQLRLTGLQEKSPQEKVLISTLNDISYRCFESHFPEEETRPKVLWGSKEDREQKTLYFINALAKTKEEFPGVGLLNEDNRAFLENEINWLKACMYLTEEKYLEADRSKTGRKEEEVKLLPKKSRQRKAVFRLHENLRSLMREDTCCEFIDTEIAAVNYVRKNPVEKYTHIIVDESQDLSRLQFEFLRHLLDHKKHSTVTFLYDISQSIYPNSWLGMGNSFASAGFDVTGRTRILRNNYRTSNEILGAARNMISSEGVLSDGEPFYCNQSGIRPLHIECHGQDQQNREVLRLVNQLKEKFGLEDIAITSRYNKNLQEIKDLLDANHIESEIINRNTDNYGKSSVKLITFHSFKGIESQVVIIPDLVAGQFPYMSATENMDDSGLIEERKLFYVAMTRASKMLFLFSYGQPSPFLNDIAPELLRKINMVSPGDPDIPEEPAAEWQSQADYRDMLREIEGSYGVFVNQRERLQEAERKSSPDAGLMTMLIDFVKENHVLEDSDEGKPGEELLEGVLNEILRKRDENKQLNARIREVLHANQEMLTEKPRERGYEEIYKQLQGRYPLLEANLLSSLASIEVFIEMLKDKNVDFSAQYIAFGKVIESLLKAAVKEYGLEVDPGKCTLGNLFYTFFNEVDDWNRVLGPLDRIRFIDVRNGAAHSKRTDFAELARLRSILYDQNVLGEIIEMVA